MYIKLGGPWGPMGAIPMVMVMVVLSFREGGVVGTTQRQRMVLISSQLGAQSTTHHEQTGTKAECRG